MDGPTQDRRRAQRVALWSLIVAGLLAILKAIAAALSGSVAVASEVAHSALDAGSSGLTFFAVRVASKPPDKEHPYGHGRAENIGALIETMVLTLVALTIAFISMRRLLGDPTKVIAHTIAIAVLLISIGVDINRSRMLRKAAREFRSAALEADALHFTADFATASLALASLLAVRMGFDRADAIGGIAIALYVAFSAVRLGRKSAQALMDRAPAGITEAIVAAVSSTPGIEQVRRVRVRSVGGHLFADVVVAVSRSAPLEGAHQVSEDVEAAVRSVESSCDVVVHVEPLANEATISAQVEAIARRELPAGQVHNVIVTSQDVGHAISLHVKFPGNLTLTQAHEMSEQLERKIADEVSGIVRIDSHLEPLDETEIPAVDVTAERADLVDWIFTECGTIEGVLRCHEAVVSSSGASLSVVVHCEADPLTSIETLHPIATEIETRIHRRWPEVARVTVHFEPGLV